MLKEDDNICLVTSTDNKPLVTLVVFAYNQQNFIRDAILGAFAQTYAKLEIILSDDCSTDDTFKIMQEMSAAYVGEHRLVINRNVQNLNIVNHLDKVYRLAHGRLLVNAAGDDISYPERVSRLVEAWLANDVRPSLIFSNAIKFDVDNASHGFLINPDVRSFYRKYENPFNETFLHGCTAAIDRSLIEFFKPINTRFYSEDALSFRRAHLVNGVFYIPDVLVKYRVGVLEGQGNISHLNDKTRKNYIKFQLSWANDRLARCAVHRSDIAKINPKNKSEFLSLLSNQEKKDLYLTKILGNNFILSTIFFLRAVCAFRSQLQIVKEYIKNYLIRWVPISHRLMNK